MPAASPAIANEFLRRAQRAGIPLTQMQLQKLVYISHGWNLAINNGPLTTDQPEAWDYGPVYRELYGAISKYGRLPVAREICRGDHGDGLWLEEDEQLQPDRATLTVGESAVIDKVFRDYGKFHAYQLSALTHKDGTPWHIVYDNGLGRFSQIDNGLVQRHFIELGQGRR